MALGYGFGQTLVGSRCTHRSSLQEVQHRWDNQVVRQFLLLPKLADPVDDFDISLMKAPDDSAVMRSTYVVQEVVQYLM